MSKRECLECSEPLKGRADQKFCCDACRNAYNNRRITGSSRYIQKVNRILKKNNAILTRVNPNEKTTVSREILEIQGFNFHYFTHLHKSRNGRLYYFCYDQGLSALNNKKYLLLKKNFYQ